MSGNTVDHYIRKRGDPLKNVESFPLWNAHAAHSRIDLEIDANRRAARHLIEMFRFLKTGDCGNKTALRDRRSLSRQSWPQNDDRMRNGFTQRHCLFEVRHAEKLRVICKHISYANQTMPVSVRLYDSKHFSRTDAFAYDFCIVTQRTSIDLNPATISFRHFGIVMCGSRK